MVITHKERFTKEVLSGYFHLPIVEVSKTLGICTTMLKKICRKNGISRWPYRKIRSIDKTIEGLEILLRETPADAAGLRREIAFYRAKRQNIIEHPETLFPKKRGQKALIEDFGSPQSSGNNSDAYASPSASSSYSPPATVTSTPAPSFSIKAGSVPLSDPSSSASSPLGFTPAAAAAAVNPAAAPGLVVSEQLTSLFSSATSSTAAAAATLAFLKYSVPSSGSSLTHSASEADVLPSFQEVISSSLPQESTVGLPGVNTLIERGNTKSSVLPPPLPHSLPSPPLPAVAPCMSIESLLNPMD